MRVGMYIPSHTLKKICLLCEALFTVSKFDESTH